LSTSFEPAAVVAAVSTVTYGTRAEADGTLRLVRLTPQSEQPMLSEVVSFDVRTVAADPFTVTRVEVRLRVQVAEPGLRGPAGALFRTAGTSSHPGQWVPDLDLALAVVPRNLRW
jgi:hypothetical protein